jgi:hypothetical protein
MLQTPVGDGKLGLDEVDLASGGHRYWIHGTSLTMIAVLTLPNGYGRRLYQISEWLKRRKLYRGPGVGRENTFAFLMISPYNASVKS